MPTPDTINVVVENDEQGVKVKEFHTLEVIIRDENKEIVDTVTIVTVPKGKTLTGSVVLKTKCVKVA